MTIIFSILRHLMPHPSVVWVIAVTALIAASFDYRFEMAWLGLKFEPATQFSAGSSTHKLTKQD